MDFTSYYDKEVKVFFTDVDVQEEKIEEEHQAPEKGDRSFNKKIRMTYSEPYLIDANTTLNE